MGQESMLDLRMVIDVEASMLCDKISEFRNISETRKHEYGGVYNIFLTFGLVTL